jgi:hypothetical protein
MLCLRLTIASLVLLGYQPVTAQSKDPSTVKDPPVIGRVLSRGAGSVSVKTEQRTRVFQINSQTEIWRGGTVDISELRAGDEVAVRYHSDNRGSLIAYYIEANVDHWEGVITKVEKNIVYIRFDPPVKRSGKVIFDDRTEFRNSVSTRPGATATLEDLKVGQHLDTIGLILGKRELRATNVLGIQDH